LRVVFCAGARAPESIARAAVPARPRSRASACLAHARGRAARVPDGEKHRLVLDFFPADTPVAAQRPRPLCAVIPLQRATSPRRHGLFQRTREDTDSTIGSAGMNHEGIGRNQAGR